MNHGNMDTTKAVARHIGLCAGYGGIELGLKRVIRNLRTVALCEVEAFAVANLVAKMEAGLMDPAPIWPDLRTFPYESFHGRVDILTGGYPCQPFSAAGQRRGKDDPRHLWPYIADGIRLLRPKLCFFENVEGHISLGLSDVIEDLAGMGYRTTWGIFSASECGAPHQRKRVFILADRYDGRSWENIEPAQSWSDWPQQSSGDTRGSGCQAENGKGPIGQGQTDYAAHSDDSWPSRPGEQQYGWEPPRVVGDTNHGRQPSGIDAGSCTEADRGGQGDVEQAESGQTQPSLGGDFDGIAGRMDYAKLRVSCESRTDELRLLGNGVVPATAALAFRTLAQKLLNPPANFSADEM